MSSGDIILERWARLRVFYHRLGLAPAAADHFRAYGDGPRTFAIHRADGSVQEHQIEVVDNGYTNEWRNFYEAIVHGEPIVATVAQSYKNMQIVLRALDSAEGAGEIDLAPDAPGGLHAQALPLWKPRGAAALFDGLPTRVSKAIRQA